VKRGRASTTSSLVTLFRALGDSGFTNVRGFKDPTARRLLPPKWASRLDKIERRRKRSARSREALVRAGDAMALRTMVLDDALREAISGGARQLVILGAGLDGRAFRMPELAEVDVLELDHPDTQTWKRERSAALERTCRSLRFVAIDFEKAALEQVLEDAGQRASEPTIWLWEGVVMYLRDAAVRSTLGAVAARSAPGSTIAVQYNTREGRSFLSDLVLRLWGEPQIGLRSPGEMAAELEAAGFRVVSDSGSIDWASRHGAPPPHMTTAKRLRIAVARK
jgi:methyltransferase (TIGR00027 family)